MVAAFAGLASFLSPCMLPVIPAFLAQLAGTSLDVSDLRRRDVLLSTVLFVVGFSAVFAGLGVTLGAVLQEVATEALAWLSRIAGTVVILLGLHLTGLLRLPLLDRQYSPLPGLRSGHLAPLLFGASFAVAWTPCVGPTLGAILSAAALTESTGRAALLLVFYSAGLAIPFLLTAVAFNRMTTLFAVVKRHYTAIVATGGAILIVMGILIWTGELTQLNVEAQRLLDSVGLDFLYGI